MTSLLPLLFLLAAEPDAAPSDASAPPKVRFFGEGAVRGEIIEHPAFGSGDDKSLARARFRLRLGVEAHAKGRLLAGARLSTGDPAVPPGSFAPLGRDFKPRLIKIDQAYVGFHAGSRVDVRAGLGENPLFRATSLVWDPDVQPAGVSETVELGRRGLTLAAGQYAVREARSRPDGDGGSFLLVEGLSGHREAAWLRATFGVSHYFYTAPDGLALALQTGDLAPILRTNRYDPRGRTIPDPARPGERIPVDFFSGFSIVDAGLRLDHATRPFALSVEAASNLRARRDPSLGAAYADRAGFAWFVLARYGRTARPWQVQGGLGYAHIPSDAVLAVYSADNLQQTNVRCVPVDLRVRLPGRALLVWDTYVQHKLDPAAPTNAGAISPSNAARVRSRLTVVLAF